MVTFVGVNFVILFFVTPHYDVTVSEPEPASSFVRHHCIFEVLDPSFRAQICKPCLNLPPHSG